MTVKNIQQNINKTQDWILHIEEVCAKCGIKCCEGAHPPICENRYDLLIKNGVSKDCFEFEGYLRLKVKKNNECVLFHDGKCSIHHIKPETCRAGPFTFDIKDDIIEIFLKYESLCPIVRVLKDIPEAYDRQYLNAIENISNLVSNLCENELEAIHRIDEPLTEKVAQIPRKYNENRNRT
jgi:Fe-S-cluster containining protein